MKKSRREFIKTTSTTALVAGSVVPALARNNLLVELAESSPLLAASR